MRPSPGTRRAPQEPEWTRDQRPKRQRRERRRRVPRADLLRVVRHLERLVGETAGTPAEVASRVEALLSDPEEARRVLEVLRREEGGGA